MANEFHIKEFYQLQGEVKGIKDNFDLQFKSLRELINANFAAIARSTDKALEANDKRLEGMNEFRDTLKDQTSTFITKRDFENQHDRVKEDIKRLEISKAEMNAKADQKATDDKFASIQITTNRVVIFTIISIAIAIIGLLIDYFKN